MYLLSFVIIVVLLVIKISKGKYYRYKCKYSNWKFNFLNRKILGFKIFIFEVW